MSVQTSPLDEFASLTGFKRDILWTLYHEEVAYGLRIKELLEEHYDEINHGRLYPNLDGLVERGLIDKRERDRRTNEYELTARATSMLTERQAWERGEE